MAYNLSRQDLNAIQRYGRLATVNNDKDAMNKAAECLVIASGNPEEQRSLEFWLLEGVRNAASCQGQVDDVLRDIHHIAVVMASTI